MSRHTWLGSSILAGFILAFSLPAMATAQNQTGHMFSASNSLQVTSAGISTETVSEVVHRQFKWSSDSLLQVVGTTKQQISRSDSSNLTEHALSLLGVPYVFGGTSRSGFDCSGYTQYVFKGSGIYLPRTAGEQFKVGSSVEKSQLRTGDLVFFSTYTLGASHVGIYIGGGRFVHASNSGVKVTSLSDSYYAKRYLGARRVQ